MNWPPIITLLLAAVLLPFAQCSLPGLRPWLGVQPDLLPGLMVFTGLSAQAGTISLVALTSGLALDSLSLNPLGLSILPLLAVGLSVHWMQELILRDQIYGQAIIGLLASIATQLLSLSLLTFLGESPASGLQSWVHGGLVAAFSAITTPVLFLSLDRIHLAFNHPALAEIPFRPDRQIKRGRT